MLTTVTVKGLAKSNSRSTADRTRNETLSALRSLLDNDAFVFADRDRLVRAVDLCARESRDFADAMMALTNAAAGCASTASFDKAMRGLPGVEVI